MTYPSRRLLLAPVAALGLAAATVFTPAHAAGATAQLAPKPIVVRSADATPTPAPTGVTAPQTGATVGVTSTQTLTAPTGRTTVYVPYQVTSGTHLVVQVQTQPRAQVTLTIGFPDGTALVRYRRAGPAGNVRFTPTIAYQPQGSAESATIMVTATLRSSGLADTVRGTVTVLQHIVLRGSLRLPRSVVAGHTLVVTAVSNHPGTLVRFVLVYPDGQAEPFYGGYTDSAGALTGRFPVSRSDGTGVLQVQVLLSYQGVERRYTGRVALRAAKLKL